MDGLTDPLHPPAPRPAYFESARGAWILSCYADVAAAFREPRLWPVGTRRRERSQMGDEAATAKLRADLQAALAPAILAEWEARFARLAREGVDALPVGGPVDLVADVLQPWSLQVAATVSGADPHDAGRLLPLARAISAASAEPYDEALQAAKATANPELERYFAASAIPMAAAAFVALSHTLPALVANMWTALLRHPPEMRRLRDDAGLVPRAMEELLRYAGLARMLFRQALEDVSIGPAAIAQGGTVVLMVASANRDPDRFAHPDRLDLGRRPAGQLSLGLGGHACGGSALVRMAATVAVREFVERFASAELREPVEWRGGSGFRTPASLRIG